MLPNVKVAQEGALRRISLQATFFSWLLSLLRDQFISGFSSWISFCKDKQRYIGIPFICYINCSIYSFIYHYLPKTPYSKNHVILVLDSFPILPFQLHSNSVFILESIPPFSMLGHLVVVQYCTITNTAAVNKLVSIFCVDVGGHP